MDLSDAPMRVRAAAFPPGPGGVLVPLRGRRAAALGVAMYTASKPAVLTVQRAAFVVASVLGGWTVPGRRQHWSPPFDESHWAALVDEWTTRFGHLAGFSVYRRRQSTRGGATIVVRRRSASPLVLKLRAVGDGALDVEQEALAMLAKRPPSTFRAPRPLGHGELAGHEWSAQAAVFTRPHGPCLDAPAALFDELTAVVDGLGGRNGSVQHGDLTPWNLRIDHRGDRWLFDWETVAPLPPGADRAYYLATVAALRDELIGDGDVASVELATWEHWMDEVRRRVPDGESDRTLHRSLLGALDDAVVRCND